MAMLRRVQSNSQMSTMTTCESLADFGLDNVDCPICHNTGKLLRKGDNGELFSRDCECMAKRVSLRRIERSGMSDMLNRYTFQTYETPDAARVRVKIAAEKFCKADEGWWYIAGQSGSGKTHICTAICSELIERGKNTRYMRWRDESRELKALINSDEIEPKLKSLKEVEVLYIDDFLKGGANEADIRLAFEIINARYNNSKLRTLISSEIGIEELLQIDEALGGRIYERSKGFRLSAPSEDWRLR